jgi:CheY-like chemotaxis protein
MIQKRFPRSDSARSRHILVIEDNPDGRESLRMLLDCLGYQVDVASNGLEGLHKALATHPDVAIVDIGLSLLDGYQVARRIRAAFGQNISLIAYTAYDGPETQRRVQEAGFDAHLVKPIELSELVPWLGEEVDMSSALCSC